MKTVPQTRLELKTHEVLPKSPIKGYGNNSPINKNGFKSTVTENVNGVKITQKIQTEIENMNSTGNHPKESFPNSCKKDSCLSVTQNHNSQDQKEIPHTQHNQNLIGKDSKTITPIPENSKSSTKTTILNEETESSSCIETSGTEGEAECDGNLFILRKENTICKLSWRWSWLQFQLLDLRRRKDFYNEKLQRMFESIKKEKSDSPTISSEENTQKQTKSIYQTDELIHYRSCKYHPLFSLKSKKRPCSKDLGIHRKRKYNKKSVVNPIWKKARKKGEEDDDYRPLPYLRDKLSSRLNRKYCRSTSSALELDIDSDYSSSEDIDIHLEDDDIEEDFEEEEETYSSPDEGELLDKLKVTPKTPKSPGTPLTPRTLYKKNVGRRTADYNFNNIIIPCSSPIITPKEVVQIHIPKWKDVVSDPDIPSSDVTENIKIEPNDNTDEDTSDEFYVIHHFRRELEERRRYISNKKTLSILTEQFPQEFKPKTEFEKDTKVATPQPELIVKLQKKFQRIRERYYDPPKFARNWRKRKLEDWSLSTESEISSDLEDILDSINSSRRGRRKIRRNSKAENVRWEVVKKPPLLDPITNRERNIIWLRRIETQDPSMTSSYTIEWNPSTPPSPQASNTNSSSPTLTANTMLTVDFVSDSMSEVPQENALSSSSNSMEIALVEVTEKMEDVNEISALQAATV